MMNILSVHVVRKKTTPWKYGSYASGWNARL